MKHDMILAGVGGQGVLSVAAVIGYAAVQDGLRIKQAEVHGMSQRGGAVQSHLRLSDRPIHSDLIATGAADMVLSMEPMETLRYVPFLSQQGVIVADRRPFVNILDYPALETVIAQLETYPNVVLIDAQGAAKAIRAIRSSNMVLMGAASWYLPLTQEMLENAIGAIFGRKGEAVVDQNIAAFRAGRDLVSAGDRPEDDRQ